MEVLDPRLAKALASSQRVEILAVLSQRQISPVGYAREYGGKLSSVAYHFKVLEGYEFIELAETVSRRGALEHVYRCSTHRRFTWALLSVDREGRQEAMTVLASTLAKIEKIDARANGRMEKSGEKPTPIAVSMAGLESPPRTRRRK